MPSGLSLKPHNQAYRCDAATTPPPETRVTELGSGIGDRFNRIRACDADAWPWILPHLQCLDVLPRPLAPPLRPPSRYFTLYFSLFFSLNLWVLLWSVDGFVLRERERERESSFSFWTDSLSLSLYNYSIYLPLCFFTLSIGVSLCWSNDGNDWEILKSILGKRRNQEKLKLEQTCKKRWDFRFEKLKLEQRCKKQWDFRFLFIFG